MPLRFPQQERVIGTQLLQDLQRDECAVPAHSTYSCNIRLHLHLNPVRDLATLSLCIQALAASLMDRDVRCPQSTK